MDPGKCRSALVALLLAFSGCGGGSTPAQAPNTPSSPPAGAQHAANGVFDVVVLVGTLPRTPSRAEVERVFSVAATALQGKTGERMVLRDVVFGVSGSNPSADASLYIASHSQNPPEGVIVLSEDSTARTFGGYSVTVVGPAGYQSEFSSPRVGADKVYVAVVRLDHPYARCGYDDAGNRISDVSVGGECRNQPGTACVARGDRYMCATAVNDLYAQPDVFPASTFVHEFMHPFGFEANGSQDHYATSQCIQRSGMSPQQASSVTDFQQNYGMCPDVYPRFRRTR